MIPTVDAPIDLLAERRSGVLLHATSLPGPYGVGDLGPEARRFADFLGDAGQSIWQLLPLGPVGYGNSPYSAHSAFAGSPLLISLDDLLPSELLEPGDLEQPPDLPARRADYAAAALYRDARLRIAYRRLAARQVADASTLLESIAAFRRRAAGWLEDFALYTAIKHRLGGGPWVDWPAPLRDRKEAALDEARRELGRDVEYVCFQQWLFDSQWQALRSHSRRRGVALLGDLPLLVAGDSADVWAHRECFRLDRSGRPAVLAGVPPDYFSASGQLWGNPLYDWESLAADGYRWWVERVRWSLGRFDALRVDHFIGLVRAWEIPAGSTTADNGRYAPGPGAALLSALEAALGALPLVAEDLGVVTPEVKALRDRFGLPGIRVLQFAFGDDPCAPDFKPHNYPRRTLAVTGTHDNDTTVGWFRERGGDHGTRSPAQTDIERRACLDYLGASDDGDLHWRLIRLLLSSVAELAVVPMQDLLGLGSEARMNRPGTLADNWEWRLLPGQAGPEVASRLRHLCALYDRLPRDQRA